MTVDHLASYDVESMDDAEIRGFLASHSVGVLGLQTDGAPSMRPMSFWYDSDDDDLYLLYLRGGGSRKADLSERDGPARFLVYSVESQFNWRSVLLTGTLEVVATADQSPVWDQVRDAWRPDALKQALDQETATLYRFAISEWSGIECLGIPPAFEEPADDE